MLGGDKGHGSSPRNAGTSCADALRAVAFGAGPISQSWQMVTRALPVPSPFGRQWPLRAIPSYFAILQYGDKGTSCALAREADAGREWTLQTQRSERGPAPLSITSGFGGDTDRTPRDAGTSCAGALRAVAFGAGPICQSWQMVTRAPPVPSPAKRMRVASGRCRRSVPSGDPHR